jgi:hypothetical protein
LSLGAGEPRLQLTDFLAQQLDAFFGFLVHGEGTRSWAVNWSLKRPVRKRS